MNSLTPTAAPSAPTGAGNVGAPVAEARSNDGDADDRPVAPASSPAAQSSNAVQTSLSALTLGG